MPDPDPEILSTLADIVGRSGEPAARGQDAVQSIATAFDAMTCTLHRADPDTRILHHVAAVGLPEAIIERTRTIPFGKGMAGICYERREPVTVCNLQTDDSGVARPAARQSQVAGALVVPILVEAEVRGTLGIGKSEDHDYAPEEILLLRSCGELLVTLFP